MSLFKTLCTLFFVILIPQKVLLFACDTALLNETRLSVAQDLSPEIKQALLSFFPKAKILEGDKTEIDISALSETEKSTLKNDLAFFAANPFLPLENIFSTLDNYQPQNSSQDDALKAARKLIEIQPSQGVGLFLEGNPGLGKTHLAVAVAKEFFKRGLRVLYLNSHQPNIGTIDYSPEKYDVFILDDLNCGYHPHQRTPFTKIVYKVHSSGGKLFVTTNSTYEKFIDEAIESNDRARYTDRATNMFKILRLKGESYRKTTGWID